MRLKEEEEEEVMKEPGFCEAGFLCRCGEAFGLCGFCCEACQFSYFILDFSTN